MENRGVLELLEMLLNGGYEWCYNNYDCSNLCGVIYMLNTYNLSIDEAPYGYAINDNENMLLVNYLIDNSPNGVGIGQLWFDRGELSPRVKWLEQQINKLKN